MRFPRCSLLLLALASCDRPAAPVAATQAAGPTVYAFAELSPIASLVPARATHVMADTQGNLFWSQESPKGDDTLFLFRDGVPRATKLSARAVLDALGAPATATGNFHSLLVDRGDQILFYFSGGWARTSAAAIGRFDPRTEKLTILIPPAVVAESSGLTAGIGLAHGTLIATAGSLYLHLVSPAESLLLRCDRATLSTARPTRPFANFETPDGPLPIRGESQRFAAAGNDDLLLLDPQSAALWRVDPGGRATLVHSLVAVPETLSTPVSGGEVIAVFAADSNGLPATNENRADPTPLTGQPPYFVTVAGGKLRSLGRNQIHAPAGTAVYQMQFQQLVLEPGTPNLLGYDATSGLLYRIRLVPKSE